MTQQGFNDYLFTIFGYKTGTAKSYITAIQIIDELFLRDDVFHLQGKSITTIKDLDLLKRIKDFVCMQQSLFIKGEFSFFRNVNTNQVSYPGKRFCSAAIKRLLNYCLYDYQEEKAWCIVKEKANGKKISKNLVTLFDIDKEGRETTIETNIRLGQGYFRKMVLQNYGCKCCVTGLNIPQILRASHIVAWATDKANRMNPENGLCLSATYDAAFDKHLISFDDDYRMIVSKEIKDFYTNDVSKTYFENYEGKQITLPTLYLPSKKLLAKHRDVMVG